MRRDLRWAKRYPIRGRILMKSKLCPSSTPDELVPEKDQCLLSEAQWLRNQNISPAKKRGFCSTGRISEYKTLWPISHHRD